MSVSGSQLNCQYMDCVCQVAAIWQIMFSACPVSSAKWEIKITWYENYYYGLKWYVLGRMGDGGIVMSRVLISFWLKVRFRELWCSYRSGLSSQEWMCNCPHSLKPLCLPQKLSITEYAPAWEFLLLPPAKFAETESPPSATHNSNLAKTTPSGNLFVFRLKEPIFSLEP